MKSQIYIKVSILFCTTLYPLFLNAHYLGYFIEESEAKKRALELGCQGTFRIKDMWMPCKNEMELHKFLRKN